MSSDMQASDHIRMQSHDIVAADLHVTLGNATILGGINLHVAPGQCVGLIGPNGAGKTTLLRALLGLVPVTADRLAVAGRDMAGMPIKERAKYFSYLPQGAPVHWPMTVRSIVELGRMPYRHPWRNLSDADHAAVDAAMVKTGVMHFAKRLVTNLSGGERARVMLARAIAVGAPFLLADEPAASLDPEYQLEMATLLRTQVDDQHGVIVVTHDLNLAQQFCDRLLVINKGAIVADGAPEHVLTDAVLADVFRVDAVRWQAGDHKYIVPTARSRL